jgi:putative flavoprotein involved in K+ transport
MAKEMVDGFISKNQLAAALPEIDEDDLPDTNAACVSGITSLNFAENNIQSIIWATGFNVDHSYIKLPVFDNTGNLEHKDGIPSFPGIYFVGYPWLRVRGSAIIFGIKEDAKFIMETICNRSMEGLKPTRRTDAVNI